MSLEGKAKIHVNASPEEAYNLVSDVTRMGEWSPECYRCEWQDGATGPTAGARFRGWNKSSFLKWSRLVEIAEAKPGEEFTFVTLKDFMNKDSTIWRYRFKADNGGTTITETYKVTAMPTIFIRFLSWLASKQHDMTPHMERTLEGMKSTIENSVSSVRV